MAHSPIVRELFIPYTEKTYQVKEHRWEWLLRLDLKDLSAL
jgi:hypothetical protein